MIVKSTMTWIEQYSHRENEFFREFHSLGESQANELTKILSCCLSYKKDVELVEKNMQYKNDMNAVLAKAYFTKAWLANAGYAGRKKDFSAEMRHAAQQLSEALVYEELVSEFRRTEVGQKKCSEEIEILAAANYTGINQASAVHKKLAQKYGQKLLLQQLAAQQEKTKAEHSARAAVPKQSDPMQDIFEKQKQAQREREEKKRRDSEAYAKISTELANIILNHGLFVPTEQLFEKLGSYIKPLSADEAETAADWTINNAAIYNESLKNTDFNFLKTDAKDKHSKETGTDKDKSQNAR